MTPKAFTLTLVTTGDSPEDNLPALTACYDSDDAFAMFGHAEVVTLTPTQRPDAWTELELRTIGHINCNCTHPKISTTKMQARSSSAERFLSSMDASPQFYWIVSTPSFEGRALVDSSTHSITDKQVIQRLLH